MGHGVIQLSREELWAGRETQLMISIQTVTLLASVCRFPSKQLSACVVHIVKLRASIAAAARRNLSLQLVAYFVAVQVMRLPWHFAWRNIHKKAPCAFQLG